MQTLTVITFIFVLFVAFINGSKDKTDLKTEDQMQKEEPIQKKQRPQNVPIKRRVPNQRVSAGTVL